MQCIQALITLRPYKKLIGLRYESDEWVLSSLCDNIRYESLSILFHNDYFQLLKLEKNTQHRIIILFNDQVSIEQLRVIHLKSV